MAPSPASIWLCPWGLPSAAREQVHLEEGVSGCYGEVRRRWWDVGGGVNGKKMKRWRSELAEKVKRDV